MTVTEKAQAAIITAHIRAAIRYTRDIAAGEPPAIALFWATNAALTVEHISVEGARRIATAVADEYDHYASPVERCSECGNFLGTYHANGCSQEQQP